MTKRPRLTRVDAIAILSAHRAYLLNEGFEGRADDMTQIIAMIDPDAERPRPEPIRVSRERFGAICPGCGTAVAAAGQVCPVCAQKPQYQAPKATTEIAKQPDPAYRDAPNVPRV